MTTWEFQASRLPFLGATRAAASRRPAGGGRASLAIISVFDELCGIASYTHFLQKQLREVFDVTVFELDQYLLRAAEGALRRLGDQHIGALCSQLAHYDAVNLQLEHGTLGRLPADICRRFAWIVAAAPQISVTFHTVIPAPKFEVAAWLGALGRLHLPTATRIAGDYFRQRRLSRDIPRRLRQAQRRKPVSAIVHNRRDMRQMKHVHNIRSVHDHPLAFIGRAEAQAIRKAATRARFPLLDAVPADAKLLGVFGFLGRYKGYDTVLRAMQHLPPPYHLLVFGVVHPNEIRRHQAIDPYLANLLDTAYIDTNLVDPSRARGGEFGPGLSLSVDASAAHVLTSHPKDLSGRVHFMGALDHTDFLAGMAICDAVIMPYLEVGQSSSGPISQALEMGCRTIASRTQTFLQLDRYHKNAIEFFDIGNHLELAELIMARPQSDPRERVLAYDTETNNPRERVLAYDTETNKAIYLAANPKPAAGQAAPIDGELEIISQV